MPIRLIALDLDGTLLNSRGEITGRNRAAIDEARRRGVRVALVTGRRFRDARPLALELGLDVPVISHNGALTKHARTLETVAALVLPLEATRDVLRVGRRAGADALVSVDPAGPGLMVYDHVSEDNHALEKYIAWSRRVVGDDPEEVVRRVPSLEAYLDSPPVHVAFSGTCEKNEAARRIVAARDWRKDQVALNALPAAGLRATRRDSSRGIERRRAGGGRRRI